MRLPATRRPVDGSPPLRSARTRLALHYATALCVVAAAVVGVIYLVLASTLDVDTTRSRTVSEPTPDGQTEIEQEVTTDIEEEEVEGAVTRQTLDRLRNASIFVLAGLLGVSLVVGWIIAGRVLAPIEAAMSTQRRFVRDASHELRNPLAVMRASLDLALEDPATPNSTWRKVGRGMRDTVDRMATVVDSLLRTARDDVPAMGASQFDPAAILRRLAAQVEPTAAGRDITLVVEAEPSRLAGDPASIERALANLVDNALRHAPPCSTVTLGGTASGDSYDIRVHDTGPGIAPEDVDAVFDRGHRSPDSPGLGLGLAIARDIIEAHDGRISLDATGPAGTTFLVSLPAAPDPAG